MPEDFYLQFLRDELTESAASTLTQSTVKTGLAQAIQDVAMEIWSVTNTSNAWEDLPATGGVESVVVMLNAKTGLAAMGNIDDVEVLYLRKRYLKAGVATYLPLIVYENGHGSNWNPIRPKLYASPNIYHYIETSNSTAAGVSQVEVGFVYVKVTQATYLEILQTYQQLFG